MYRPTNTQHFHTLADLERKAIRGVESLIRVVSRNAESDDGFDRVKALLESLPLSTHEFAVAASRLVNARRYVVADERGAAAYELKLLIGGLGNGSPVGTAAAGRLQ